MSARVPRHSGTYQRYRGWRIASATRVRRRRSRRRRRRRRPRSNRATTRSRRPSSSSCGSRLSMPRAMTSSAAACRSSRVVGPGDGVALRGERVPEGAAAAQPAGHGHRLVGQHPRVAPAVATNDSATERRASSATRSGESSSGERGERLLEEVDLRRVEHRRPRTRPAPCPRPIAASARRSARPQGPSAGAPLPRRRHGRRRCRRTSSGRRRGPAASGSRARAWSGPSAAPSAPARTAPPRPRRRAGPTPTRRRGSRSRPPCRGRRRRRPA